MVTKDFASTKLVVGLGASRTGTAWMSDYFAKHPDVLMSPLRVLHYFDVRYEPEEYARYEQHFVDRFQRQADKIGNGKVNSPLSALRDRAEMMHTPNGFLDYFRKRWSGEGAFADITPSYYKLQPEAFKGIHDIHPSVALLFVMRNPVDRFWSGLRLKRKKELCGDVYAELEKFLAVDRPIPWEKDYKGTILNLESVVPVSSIKYLFFEEMFDQETMDELCRFMSVSPFPANVDTRINQTDSAPMDERQRRLSYKRFEEIYQFVHDHFSGRIPVSWLEDMERFS